METQQFATAVYQAELTVRLQLTRIRARDEVKQRRARDQRLYPQEYIEASSPRSQQIREYLEEERTSSGPAKRLEIAAHSTRDRKQVLTLGTGRSPRCAHRQMSLRAASATRRSSVLAEARQRGGVAWWIARRSEFERQISTHAKEAVTFAKERIYEREAVTDERSA